jgi:subtilisin family serine protease
MPTFIAFPKKSDIQQINSGTLSTEDKQQSRRGSSKFFPKLANALNQKIAEALALLGFKQVSPKTAVDEPALGDEQVSNFMPLNYLGAYVVNSSNTQKIAEARKSFEALDHEVIRDVQLSLPKPICADEVFWRARRTPWPVESGIHQAHNKGVTGSGVLVGVLDTGCDADHIQLRQKQIDFRYVPHHSESDDLRDVRGFDVDGHGTHVCGIIAGKHVGIVPEVDLLVASVLESETNRTTLSRIARGLDWMLSQINSSENFGKPAIINMSLGFITEHLNKSDRNTLIVDVRRVISSLVEDYNVLPVVAIGNEGHGNMRAPGYFPETLSVGAVDFDHEPACFTGGGMSPIDDGTQPNIAGYGVDIFSCLERDRNNRSSYVCMSGTSMATPYVAGIAALCASADTKLQGKDLRQHLLNTALPLQAPENRVGVGLARFT